MNPYPNPVPGAYLFSHPQLGPAAADSLPFVATQAFLRRGLGAGAVDRCITLDTPVRFMYTNQLAGSRPPVATLGPGPAIPDQISPGLDAWLMTTAAVPGAGYPVAPPPAPMPTPWYGYAGGNAQGVRPDAQAYTPPGYAYAAPGAGAGAGAGADATAAGFPPAAAAFGGYSGYGHAAAAAAAAATPYYPGPVTLMQFAHGQAF